MKNVLRARLPIAIGLTVACVSACSAEGGDPTNSGAPDAATATAAQRTLVAEVESGGARVEFLQLQTAEQTLLAIRESGPVTSQVMPVERLSAEYRLTMLEVFYALSPNAEAPRLLVDAHPEQAAALGRQDTSEVVRVAFDANAPVEKSIASCEQWVFPVSQSSEIVNKQSLNNASGDNWLPVGTSWSYSTSGQVTLGMCNDSATAGSTQIAWDMEGDSASWIYSGVFSSPAGSRQRWYPFSRNVFGACEGLVCPVFPTRYGVEGIGTLYHLKTGEVRAIIR
jgi:hypothetical protein